MSDESRKPSTYKPVRIVFDGAPGPVSPAFVEVEDEQGVGQRVGEWKPYKDDLWTLGDFVDAGFHKEAVALAERFIPTDKLEAYIAAKYPKAGPAS